MDRRDPDRTPHGETAYSPNSLLRALTANPLDVDNLRADGPDNEDVRHADTPLSRTVTFVLAVLLGLMVVVSATTLRANATQEDSPRDQLREQVVASRERAAELEASRRMKEEEVSALQEDVLDGDPGAIPPGTDSALGASTVHGPGLLLTLDDSAPLPPAPGSEAETVNRVSDKDLQIAVNGLWAAGAEVIAVNGTRLTPTSAIRTAGSAILVDFQPLSPPYTISAIGDPEQLEAGLEAGEAGAYLESISTQYGILLSQEAVEDITIDPRSVRSLRDVRIHSEDPAAPAADVPTPEETP